MGQAGSQPTAPAQRTRRAHTLPHEPPRHAPKVLPLLTESPRLRSTDNGAILHSGGTISGRRPAPAHHQHHDYHRTPAPAPHGHVHSNVYRSRSAGASGEPLARERDPLHRSHTNFDVKHHDNVAGLNKRFGSEPDIRVEEEQQKPRCNKHFRKKYKAPQPPTNDHHREGSSPDSSEGNAKQEPHRKLRLFKTRNETKKLNGHGETKIPIYRPSSTEYKSLDLNERAFERRYRSPCKDKDQHFKSPDSKDMIQSSCSLKREEHLLQARQDYRRTRTDRVSGCRAKTTKNENGEAWKTPLLNRNFRYSERFKKEEIEPCLRRERSFDATLLSSKKENESSRLTQESRVKEQSKLSPLTPKNKPLVKSLPSLLTSNNEEKDEFQAELKKATSRIRSELVNKINVSETKTSQKDKTSAKVNPSKVVQSSLTNNVKNTKSAISRRPLTRATETKLKINNSSKTNEAIVSRNKINVMDNGKLMPDRGQASGKESTPEHSPVRKVSPPIEDNSHDTQKSAPSKQFYFGMIESKQTDVQDNLKDFPGLGSPIIEEISNFHLIEKKLLGYHEEDDEEFERFNEKLQKDCKKNLSSESALSSSESVGSAGSLGVSLRLRPTLPKKQPAVPRFSPAAAWRQLAAIDAHLASETQPLAVETKVSADISPESSPRSEQSADKSGDKSGDSGISGDHANSDHRIESPSRQSRHRVSRIETITNLAADPPATWTPQQDLGDSSSDGAGGVVQIRGAEGVATYSPGAQPFSLSLPRDNPDKGKQLQQGFNSLQKLRKSVSGALGAALGSRRFDLDHEPMLPESEQNWFLTKSAPNSLSNPLLFQQPARAKGSSDDVKDAESTPSSEKEDLSWRPSNSYLSWGGHVMYLPPAPLSTDQPISILGPIDRPVRSKSSGSLEVAARAARAAALANEMRERSASPDIARALPARVEPVPTRSTANSRSRGKRFTFQSTVRQLERRRLAEKLSREAELKEQQRRSELEAMRRVEEEFQRKRAREKASIRQQLRLVSSGATSLPPSTHTKARDEPDGSCRDSPNVDRARDRRERHSNASSEISGRSKSTTPVRCVELSEWRTNGAGARVYRDWAVSPAPERAIDHPPACARMPQAAHRLYNVTPETEAFSGSPRSDNYRLEFARGRSPRSPHSPRTPRPPRLLAATRSPSTSGSELSLRQPIKIRW